MKRVLCQATVDLIYLIKPDEKGLNRYAVEVWGKEPHDFCRLYTIAAKSDTLAAQEGIRRFVKEMESLDTDKLN
jgi:septin family protein